DRHFKRILRLIQTEAAAQSLAPAASSLFLMANDSLSKHRRRNCCSIVHYSNHLVADHAGRNSSLRELERTRRIAGHHSYHLPFSILIIRIFVSSFQHKFRDSGIVVQSPGRRYTSLTLTMRTEESETCSLLFNSFNLFCSYRIRTRNGPTKEYQCRKDQDLCFHKRKFYLTKLAICAIGKNSKSPFMEIAGITEMKEYVLG